MDAPFQNGIHGEKVIHDAAASIHTGRHASGDAGVAGSGRRLRLAKYADAAEPGLFCRAFGIIAMLPESVQGQREYDGPAAQGPRRRDRDRADRGLAGNPYSISNEGCDYQDRNGDDWQPPFCW